MLLPDLIEQLLGLLLGVLPVVGLGARREQVRVDAHVVGQVPGLKLSVQFECFVCVASQCTRMDQNSTSEECVHT